MSKKLLQGLLVGCIACLGCSSGDGDTGDGTGGRGNGGSGGAGASVPLSFDADNALSVSSANVTSLAAGAQLGLTAAAIYSALSEADSVNGAALKQGPIPLPGLCTLSGGATLTYDPSLSVGDQATVTFMDCAGTVLADEALNGTIVLTIEAVSGGFPSEATAQAQLTGTGVSVSGAFTVLGSLSGVELELFLGDQRDSDRLTITRGGDTVELACFRIRVLIPFLGSPSSTAFEPVGVVRVNGMVYTLNDYTQAPPNITFSGRVGVSGGTSSSSGDGSSAVIRPFAPPNAQCAPFAPTPVGDDSIVTNDFAGESCIQVEVTDATGATTSYETTWDKLLMGDTTPGGGDCSTEAEAGEPTCNFGTAPPEGDLVAIADTYIRGLGPEGDFRDDNYGGAGNLLIKTVTNHAFTRKIYLVFDLPDELDPDSFSSAALNLTLQRHIFDPDRDPSLNGPQPTNVYGIVDGDDWDGVDPPEVDETTGLSWNNAPKNITANANESQFASAGVELLIANYSFDLGLGPADPPNSPDPEGTRYSLDVTQYIKERLEDTADTDKVINILLAIQLPDFRNADGSAFLSKETSEVCDRPFLHFE